MKIDIKVDVTPEEARAFFGLPDVRPLQEEMLRTIRERMLAGVEGFDPMSLMRPFLAPNLQTMEVMQQAFWKAMGAGGGAESDREG